MDFIVLILPVLVTIGLDLPRVLRIHQEDMGKMIHVILPMTKSYAERGTTPGCSTDATLVHVE
jgi:hypothetical protein